MQSNTVYDPDSDQRPRPRRPDDGLDPSETTPVGDPSDPRGEYDPQTTPAGDSSDPRGDLSRGEQRSLYNPSGDRREKSSGAETLAAAEGIGSTVGQIGKGLTPEGAALSVAGRAKNMFFGSKKRRNATLGGGAIGGGITILIVILGVASGPAQLLQLDQMLQRNMNPSNHAMSNRLEKLVRKALGAKDDGEGNKTTVGEEGAADFGPAAEQMADMGISFNDDGTATINPEGLYDKYPELKDMSTDDQESWLKDNFSLSDDEITAPETKGGDFTVNSDDFAGNAESFLLSDNTVSTLEDGSILSSISNRVFGKFFGDDSLFHQLTKQKGDELDNEDAAKQISAVEDDESSATDDADTVASNEGINVDSDVSDVENDVSPSGAVEGNSDPLAALNLSGYSCTMYNLAGDINDIDRIRVMLPSIVMAMQLISIGEQVKSGQDVTASQINALLSSFVNSQGQNIFQGMALQATEGDSPLGGTDMPLEYKQAFTSSEVANDVKSATKPVIDATTLGAGAVFGPSFVCSSIPQTIANLSSVVASVGAAFFSDGASAGVEAGTETGVDAAVTAGESLETAAEQKTGTQLAVAAAKKQAKNFAISLLVTDFVSKFILSTSTLGKLAKDAFSGPLGGNLLAWGARAAGNMGAVVNGGTPLSNSQSSTQLAEEQQQSNQQFRSESFFARMFDADDYRSLTGHLADDLSPSFSQNIASFAGSFTHIGGGLLSSLASLFLPKSSADNSYYWGIQGVGLSLPQYGIPDDVLNGEDISGKVDPSMADPYQNAQIVATALDACPGSGSDFCGYVSQAQQCFGVDISKNGSGVWDVTTGSSPVDTSTYNTPDGSSDCSSDLNTSNDWRRIVLFILDTRTMQSADCYDSSSSTSDQSCSDLGYTTGGSSSDTTTGGSSSSSSSSGSSGSLPSGSAEQLATELLPYISSGKISCNRQATDCPDIQNTAKGVSIKGGEGCEVNALSPALLGMMLKLVQMGHTFVLSAICSDHTDDGGTTSGHSAGMAADFNYIDGVFMGADEDSAGTIPWTQQGSVGQQKIQADEKLIQDVTSFMPKSTGFGQVQCHQSYPALSGFVTFNDACTHQHIQVSG